MKIKIIDAFVDNWYSDMVGEIVEVLECCSSKYKVFWLQEKTGRGILKVHAEIIENIQEPEIDFSMPPILGLRPKYIADIQRTQEILEAMLRFNKAGKNIPLTWLKELCELNQQGDAK